MQVEEVIELWEKIEVCPAKDDAESNTCCTMRVSDYAKMSQALTKLRSIKAPEPTSLGNTIRNIAKSIPNETNRNIVNQAANRLDRWWRYIGELKAHLKQLQAENDKLIEQAKLQAGS